MTKHFSIYARMSRESTGERYLDDTDGGMSPDVFTDGPSWAAGDIAEPDTGRSTSQSAQTALRRASIVEVNLSASR